MSLTQQVLQIAGLWSHMLVLHLDDPANTRPEVAVWGVGDAVSVLASRELVAAGLAVSCPPPDTPPGFWRDAPCYRLTDAGVQFLRGCLAVSH